MNTEMIDALNALLAHRAEREKIEQQFADKERELLLALQEVCPHKDVRSEYFGCRHRGDEWTDHECRLCRKQWST